MKLGALTLGLVLVGTLAATNAYADGDGEMDKPEKPSSAHAHAAGVALTWTGASFLSTGAVATVGSLVLMPSAGAQGSGAVLALGGLISGACLIIGLSTLIPGVVLMANNHPPPKEPRSDLLRDAHIAPPFPQYTSVPILSASF